MEALPRFVIDSTAAPTFLCEAGRALGTDKSPLNTVGHRHPYTAVYSMLFAGLRNQPIEFAEIGVAMGSSAALWNVYFTNEKTRIHVFDRDEALVAHCIERAKGTRLRGSLMDVSVDGDVGRALQASWVSPGGREGPPEYDVILDDSSHNHEHQIRIIREAFPLLKRGGMLIVEDIFRATPDKDYIDPLREIYAQCSFAYFVDCEHQAKWSGEWNNDRILVLVKA